MPGNEGEMKESKRKESQGNPKPVAPQTVGSAGNAQGISLSNGCLPRDHQEPQTNKRNAKYLGAGGGTEFKFACLLLFKILIRI